MHADDYILVVEDDDDVREVIVEILAEHGYPARTASNGRKALEVLKMQTHPCLILLDQMMPVMGGEELIEELEMVPALASIPICVLTADVRYGRDYIAAVVTKPIDEDALLRIVHAHCGAPPARAEFTSGLGPPAPT